MIPQPTHGTPAHATTATNATVTATIAASPGHSLRWLQLALGIVCMAMIANVQYGWTLFVAPMEAKHHWGLAAIQIAFSVFVVVETWLVPIEGWLVDRFGPRPVIAGGAILAALGWIINPYADGLTELYAAAVLSGIGAGCVYGRLSHRQAADALPRGINRPPS